MAKTTKLTGIIIAKNAEGFIQQTVKSLDFCDEVLVVDGQSTDKTAMLANEAGARVVVGSVSDFSQQREVGMREAKGEWILYVDTDERVSLTLKKHILQVVEKPHSLDEPSAYLVLRKNYYYRIYKWPGSEKLERLFFRKLLKGWKGQLHESPIVDGRIGLLKGELQHYTHRDLSSMVDKTIEWSTVEATLRYRAQHPAMAPWRLLRVFLSGLWESYIQQKGWRVGTPGIIEGIYQGFSMLITYAKLWEMQHQKNR
jgi:hypothetical protein